MYFVLLRQHNGKPWDGLVPRLLEAPNPDIAAHQAYNPVPSSREVEGAFVVEVVCDDRGMEQTFFVPIEVPKPKWKTACQARPAARAS